MKTAIAHAHMAPVSIPPKPGRFELAQEIFAKEFGPEAQVFFGRTASRALVLGAAAFLREGGALIYTDGSTISARAIKSLKTMRPGLDLAKLDLQDKKLTPQRLAQITKDKHPPHGVLILPACTRQGIPYHADEIQALQDVCRQVHLVMGIDGRGLINAACA
jgi:threonine aldolase